MKHLVQWTVPVAVAVALAGCQAATPSPAGRPASATASAAASANTADVMFAQMMIPHHQQAVQMSEAMLAKPGIAAEVTELATAIKAAQQPEIDQMNGWLAQWGAPEGGEHSGHGGMDGMMTEQEMAALRGATGVEAEKVFLSGMIRHHEGAVTMAQQVQSQGSHPEVKRLAAAIISTQQAEIATMRTLLQKRS